MQKKSGYVFRVSFIFANLGYFSLLIVMSLLLKAVDKNSLQTFTAWVPISILPFILSYYIWYFLFSTKMSTLKSLNGYIKNSILGAFFISLMTAFGVGLISGKPTGVIFYIVGGLIYSTPFNLLFGAVMGNFLYCKNK